MSIPEGMMQRIRAARPKQEPSLDSFYAEKLRAECSSSDIERNGCEADRIIGELLRHIGMQQTADAYEALDLLRA